MSETAASLIGDRILPEPPMATRKSAKKGSANKAAKKPAPKRAKSPADPLARLRALCLSLPEAHEVEAWGEPTFRVKNKIFAMYAKANNHHGGGRNAIWCKAKPVNQRLMIDAAPDRFFSPAVRGTQRVDRCLARRRLRLEGVEGFTA